MNEIEEELKNQLLQLYNYIINLPERFFSQYKSLLNFVVFFLRKYNFKDFNDNYTEYLNYLNEFTDNSFIEPEKRNIYKELKKEELNYSQDIKNKLENIKKLQVIYEKQLQVINEIIKRIEEFKMINNELNILSPKSQENEMDIQENEDYFDKNYLYYYFLILLLNKFDNYLISNDNEIIRNFTLNQNKEPTKKNIFPLLKNKNFYVDIRIKLIELCNLLIENINEYNFINKITILRDKLLFKHETSEDKFKYKQSNDKFLGGFRSFKLSNNNQKLIEPLDLNINSSEIKSLKPKKDNQIKDNQIEDNQIEVKKIKVNNDLFNKIISNINNIRRTQQLNIGVTGLGS